MEPGAGCIANITPQGIRQRMTFGVTVILLTLVAAVVMTWFQVEWWWRAGLFIPFWLGLIGYFAATHKT